MVIYFSVVAQRIAWPILFLELSSSEQIGEENLFQRRSTYWEKRPHVFWSREMRTLNIYSRDSIFWIIVGNN